VKTDEVGYIPFVINAKNSRGHDLIDLMSVAFRRQSGHEWVKFLKSRF
jgi:hypothetical protein